MFSTFPQNYIFHTLFFPMFSIWKAVESGETPLFILFSAHFPVDNRSVKIKSTGNPAENDFYPVENYNLCDASPAINK